MTQPTPTLIHLDRDWIEMTPAELGAALAGFDEAPDSYGEGGVVARCEAELARRLGKETAVLFPTGTIANLLALDRLCPRGARRVLLQDDAHVLRDTGDGAAAIAGLTLLTAPMLDGAAVRRAAAEARGGRVAQAIGAVSVETPVRRRLNAVLPADQLAGVIEAARAEGIGLHLDGARLPIAAAAAGCSLAEFSRPFDTVYLSLWKMLGLPFGAALAGPATLLDGIRADRRRLGGALPRFWPLALLTLARLSELDPWPEILVQARAVRAGLGAAVVAAEDASNGFWMAPADPGRFAAAAARQGLVLPEPQAGRFGLRANRSWLSVPPATIVARLEACCAPAAPA